MTGPMAAGISGGPIFRLCVASMRRARNASCTSRATNHPRAGRAFLPLVAERAVDHAVHRLVEVGVVVDDDRVLAAHLGDDALDVVLPGPVLVRRSRKISNPTSREPVKAISDSRDVDERRRRLLADARQIIGTPGGIRRPARFPSACAAMTDDCSAGFMIAVLPVTSAAAVMPVRIASGKFHGAMIAATPRGS